MLAAVVLFVQAASIHASDGAPDVKTWSLRDEFRTGDRGTNPLKDREDETVWYFLRTSSSEGPVESRGWRHDGKYDLLAEGGSGL